MSNTLLINSAGYIQSQNIKVFPCAYRGYYEEPTEEATTTPTYKIINPEARTTSEYSFVNSYHKLSATKESYVISWTPSTPGASNGILKFVIGGYYFEITNCTLDDFITTDNGTQVSKTFYINIQNNGNIPGQYLGSFENNVRWLDIDTVGDNALEDFYFTGLKISATNISSSASVIYSLTPFASQYQHWRTAADSDSLEEALTDIEDLTTAERNLLYYTDEETNNYIAYSDILNPTTESFKGTVVFYKQVFDISPTALPITNLLDSGSGKYSLRVLEDIEDGTDNTTKARGDYSVALGKRTEASGLVSTTLGIATQASGEASLAAGDTTEAIGINSVATGDNTKAQGNSSITTGSYTQALEDNSFAGGKNTRANGINSFAFGENTIVTGRNAISVGYKAPNTSDVGAYGQNSITAGTDTKTTTAASNAVAIGNTTTAAGENSFVGGNNSEAKDENSFAFGNNVKTNANNQVVFGTYNVEDNTQAFIIANGTSTTKSNKFTVGYNGDIKALGTATIEGATTINSSLTTKGNITSDKTDASGNAANNLILGRDTGNSSGTINVYGRTANTKVFEVTNAGDTNIKGTATITGNTSIAGQLNVTNNTPYTNPTATTYSAALKVAGGVHIGEKLNVGNNTTIGGTLTTDGNTILGGDSTTNIVNIKKAPGEGETNVRITGSAKITSTTTINGAVGINKDTESNSKNTGALIVAGGVGIGKKLNVGSNLSVTGTTTVGGTLTTNDIVTFNKDTDYTYTNDTHNAALKVAGGVHIGKKLNVTNNVTIGGTLTTEGNTELKGNLEVDGDLTTTDGTKYIKLNNGVSSSTAYLQVNGTTEIADDLTLNKDLFVGGDLKLNGSTSTFELIDANDDSVVKLSATAVELPGTDITGSLSVTGALTASDTDSEHQIGSIKINDGAITGVSTLTASGTITANIFNATYVNTSSDRRLKQNIEDYKCEKSILDLPIKKYEYITDPTKTQIGCIAQDLQKICPELVSENEKGYLSIQENKLIYLLLQEVKTLKEKVESLERR